MNSLRECGIKPINGKIQQDIMHWQLDYSIVSKKSSNRDGEKGIAVMRRDIRDTSARRRTGQQMTTKLVSLTLRARGNLKNIYKTFTMLPTVSIIIPFIEDNDLFRLAVELCISVDYPKELLELILVYNGEGKLQFPLVLENKLSSFRLIREDRRNQYAARNTGTRIAKGELLLFTDSDCIVDKNWVRQLASQFKDNKISAVVGNVLAYKPQTALELFGNQYIFNHSKRPFRTLIGSNNAVRKRLFKELGGFDEHFVSGGDADFSIRLIKQDFYIHYEPEAIVYHKHRDTLRGLFKQYKKYGGGWWALKKKWGIEAKIYPNWKRILVFIIYLFFTVSDLLLYSLGPKTIESKAKRFRHLYFAVINLALVVGFYHRKILNLIWIPKYPKRILRSKTAYLLMGLLYESCKMNGW